MKRSHRFHFTFYILQFAIALLSPSLVLSAQPTFARLSFWLPPDRMPEFESTYQERVIPLLKTHGLAPASEVSRTTVDSVFARLFEIKSIGDVATAQEALNEDITWTSLLQNLGTIFGTSLPDGRIRTNFQIYSTPANSGVVVPAGPGKNQTADLGKGHWHTFDTTDGMANAKVHSIFQDREGYLWFGTGGGVSRYDGQTWTTFTTKDGLADNAVWGIIQAQNGAMWFSTRGGVSRYDGQIWATFTTKDGLANNWVTSVFQDREGNFWFGTWGGGVSRYDGQTWTTFTTKNGLSGNFVRSAFQDHEGTFWFGTGGIGSGGGVSCYDGASFTTFSIEHGLAHNSITSILQDRHGSLYFGTRNGLTRYNGQTWTTFTAEDGLAGNLVRSSFQDRQGNLWFGTRGGGVSRYDGQTWTTFTTQDGLAENFVETIFQDRKDILYFGTFGEGVSRYDGQSFTTLTKQDGLADNSIRAIFQDREERLWFGTLGGGVSQYDGNVFQTLNSRDGLAHNAIYAILQDREGYLYFSSTSKGVTRYRPSFATPPPVFIDAVVADRRHERISKLSMPSETGLVAFEFHGISLKTRPDGMLYQYRLKGFEENWQNTRNRRVEYEDLPRGDYTFEVQAVDRDLVYSETPATLALRVHLPYERMGLFSALSIAIALVAWQTVRVVRRDRRLQQANGALSDANKKLFQVNVDLEGANTEIQQQTERKSAFLASMSHELRTPMNAIKGFTSLVLRREKTLSDRGHENLQKVGQASDHLMALINDLLDLSKIEAGRMDVNPTLFRVEHLIASCVSTVSPLVKDGVSLNYECDNIGQAHTDEARLRQMIINLLSNAIKFTDQGEVKVTAKTDDGQSTMDDGKGDESLQLSNFPTFQHSNAILQTTNDEAFQRANVQRSNAMLVIAVSDTGKGIPADELPFIFDEYRQVKGSESSIQKGTGLGLSITKKFSELLGGTISVSSETGKGSTFTVTIPLDYGEKIENL